MCIRDRSKGCNRKLLLQIYKSLICSHLDYGAPVYGGLANKSVLSVLHTIQTSAPGLTCGAFCMSPKLSSCAEAPDPPLPFRRMILTSSFMSSVSQVPHLPIYYSIFLPVPNYLSIPSNKHIRPQFNYSFNKPFRAAPLQPIYLFSSPWTHKNPPFVSTS